MKAMTGKLGMKKHFVKLVFMGSSPICTAKDTQLSTELTKPQPLCDEMETPDNTLSHDSRENVNRKLRSEEGL